MRSFGANTVHGAKETYFLETRQFVAPVEVCEKIKPAGAGAKSPHSRSHFRNPASASEGWFVRGKAEREMGRFDD